MSQGNTMCIKYNSYKVEFALRGAGHIHGVLWVDWDNFSGLDVDKVNIIKDAFDKIRNEKQINEKHKQCISEFADLFITCTLKDPKTKAIVEEVQMHHQFRPANNGGSWEPSSQKEIKLTEGKWPVLPH